MPHWRKDRGGGTFGLNLHCWASPVICRPGSNAQLRIRSGRRGYSFAFSRRIAPEVLQIISHLSNQRAQGRPGARCTRGLACGLHKTKCTRAYRFSGEHPAFPAQWLYGLYRGLPGERAFCHRHPRAALAPRELDATTATSGPHDFAVRASCARQSQLLRPPQPAQRS